MSVQIYKVTFNSNHSKVVMKTTIWIHEDVLDYFKDNIKEYAKRKQITEYTDQQIMADQYLQKYRIILEKYDKLGLQDSHILSLKQEYEDILRKNNLLEKFNFFVVPKYIDSAFTKQYIDMDIALRLLKQLKGANGIITPDKSDWVGYYKRDTGRNLRMEIK